MISSAQTLAIAILGCALGACAFKQYAPQPLVPEDIEADFAARSARAPELRDYMQAHGLESGDWPLQRWGLPELTLLAFYYHPELRQAAARAQIARAQEQSAGQPLNPGLRIGPEYHSFIERGSPWSLGFALSIPFETMNKRGLRGEQAAYLAQAAALDVGAVAWKLRNQVRSRFIDNFVAREELALLQTETEARERQTKLLDKRLGLGMISAFEAGVARRQAADGKLRALRKKGEVSLALSRLAEAVALPDASLQDMTLSFAGLDRALAAEASALKREALTHRLDMRRLLLEYAAAETALKLEIARQYPDFEFTPGYAWDQSDNVWSLAVGLLVPVLNRNQGPIAEAEARRAAKAQDFAALQNQTIAATEQAALKYRNALAELAAAWNLQRAMQRQRDRITRQFDAGNADRLDTVTAELQVLEAGRAILQARAATLAALGELEDVLQRPLFGAFLLPEFGTAKDAH